MNPLGDLTRSFAGWSAIVAGHAQARESFRTDTTGFVAAATTLAVAILLSLALQSASVGMPTLSQLLFALLVQAVTMTLVVVAASRLLAFQHVEVGATVLLVPILYALAYAFIVGIPLTLLGPLSLLVPVALACMIWRAGIVIGSMSALAALGLALLCVIVLVVVPNALYMLLLLIPSA